MHLEEGPLEALLDNELDAVAAAEARRHLDACGQCRGELERLRSDASALEHALRALDHPAPQIPVERIVARAATRRLPLRWAAGIALLLLATGTAYALPGSPVRHWVDRLMGRAPKATMPGADVAGVALPPGQRLSVVFTEPRAPGIVSITLTDDSTIDVRRLGGAATFNAEPDRLRIETGNATTNFEIAIPRRAAWVEVIVGEQRMFLKDGPTVSGRYVF
ncbi:MAG TPA: hypothetical protein VKD28_18950 [Gemmatimonadales bacterium]|nr:hypothetical protein [Gemmatimonadales bacterium]